MRSFLLFAGLVFTLSVVFAGSYRALWRRFDRAGRVPTGFGVLLGPVFLGASLIVPAQVSLRVALAIVALATAAYWWDDAVEIRARVRLIIALATGMAVAATISFDPGVDTALIPLAAAMVLTGMVSVGVVNMVNFYDGADLNLATFIALTAMMLLAFAPAETPWVTLAAGTGAFALGFAAWNLRPRTIYLGDAGSFAFACFLTLLGLFFLRRGSTIPPEAAIPAALPAVDTAFVFIVRVREKHDLLTRNYLHLYQKLDARFRRFVYLLPQLANVILCLLAARLAETMGIPRVSAVVSASAIVTILFYAGCRRAFVRREPA